MLKNKTTQDFCVTLTHKQYARLVDIAVANGYTSIDALIKAIADDDFEPFLGKLTGDDLSDALTNGIVSGDKVFWLGAIWRRDDTADYEDPSASFYLPVDYRIVEHVYHTKAYDKTAFGNVDHIQHLQQQFGAWIAKFCETYDDRYLGAHYFGQTLEDSMLYYVLRDHPYRMFECLLTGLGIQPKTLG